MDVGYLNWRVYLRMVNMPIAATHKPTLTAMTMMMAAAKPAPV